MTTLKISVPSGSEKVDVQTSTPHSISVQDVGRARMELEHALVCRRHSPLTPYKVKAWEQELKHFHLPCFVNIPKGLRSGFVLNFPIIAHLQVPPNKALVFTHNCHDHDIPPQPSHTYSCPLAIQTPPEHSLHQQLSEFSDDLKKTE